MEINTLDALVGNLLRSPIAVIGAARYRLGSRVLLDLFKHRRQLLFVIHFLRDVGGDGDLRVVGLHEAAFVRSISHDSAIRIGEVALRGILRLRLLRVGDLWWTPA